MSPDKTILIVDDDVNLVEAIKVTLENSAYKVATAFDGEEGVKVAKEVHPDLIILDIMMDKKHGYDVCSELNQDPAFKTTPIIILTGVGRHMKEPEWSHQQGLTLVSDDFIEAGQGGEPP